MSSSFASFKRDGVWGLFFIQIFATMAFAVLYSTVVLYASKRLGLSENIATSIVATFMAFNFALHLLGGYLGGRFLSYRALFLVCTLFQIAGTLILAMVSVWSLYIGLAFFLAGSGFNSICINCLLTQLFSKQENETLQNAFLWNYSAMNFGFFVGFWMAGSFEISQNYSVLFILSSFSNVIALIATLICWRKFKDVKTYLSEVTQGLKSRFMLGLVMNFAAAFALIWLLKHATFSSDLIMWVGILTAIGLCILARQQRDKLTRERFWAFNILTLSSVLFYTLWTLLPMGLTLFISNNVNTHLFGFAIPPQWFLNVDSVVTIVGAPLIAGAIHRLRKKGVDVNIPALFAGSLLLIGASFLILCLAIHEANAQGYVGAIWIILSYFVLAVGELCLVPVSYSMVGLLAPTKLRGLLMGVTLLTSGVAATFANYFSQIAMGNSKVTNPLVTNTSYSHTFLIMGSGAIVAGLILFCLVPFILKLIREVSPA